MIMTLSILNSVVFLIYGLLCIFTNHMEKEFDRYGLKKYRIVVGYLELLGGLGVTIGLFWSSYIYIVSTIGLSLLMAIGSWTRFRVKDPWYQMIPALILLVTNIYLSISMFNIILV